MSRMNTKGSRSNKEKKDNDFDQGNAQNQLLEMKTTICIQVHNPVMGIWSFNEKQ